MVITIEDANAEKQFLELPSLHDEAVIEVLSEAVTRTPGGIVGFWVPLAADAERYLNGLRETAPHVEYLDRASKTLRDGSSWIWVRLRHRANA